MKNRAYITILIFLLLGIYPSYADESSYYIKKAANFSKNGEFDSAFINYKNVLRIMPTSQKALFALGEYYFSIHYPDKSKVSFKKYIELTDNTEGKLFALSYLLKIAKMQKNIKLMKYYETEILSIRRQGFIFKEEKEYNFLSPMYRKHKVVYTIDNISVFIEGQRFEKISF